MDKIITILKKEWAEVFKNRMVIFTVIFMPLMLTAIPLAILYMMQGEAANSVGAQLPKEIAAVCPPGLPFDECFQVYMVSQFMIMFMIIPVAIPVTIAAYSIVGEKATHSLEPLLATPITTVELLLGKILAAALPAILATLAAFAIFIAGAGILATPGVFAAFLDARWVLAVFLVGPLMAILSVNVSVIVSSRVNDPRVAEQVSMIVMVPVLGLFFAQLAGLVALSRSLVLWIALGLVVLDGLMLLLSVRLFQREVILTRWK